MNQPIIIIGTGSKGKTALEILQKNELIVYGFLDQDSSREGELIADISILGSQDDPIFIEMLGEKCAAFVALEDPLEQQEYIKKWGKAKNIPTVNAIHPHAHLASQIRLGEGNLIDVFTSIGFDATLGSYNTLESHISIGREVEIGDHVHIKAGTIIGEGVTIESNAQIGAGVTILPHITVTENVTIPAGTILKESL